MAPRSETSGSGLSVVLSLVLGLFLASACFAVLDDLMLATLGRQDFTVFRALTSLLMVPTTLVLCLMMAIWPGIPKRVFLSVALFAPIATIVSLPLLASFYPHVAWVSLVFSLLQLLTALLCIRQLRGSVLPRWPLVPASSLDQKRFSFMHFAAVLMMGFMVILPALLLGTLFSGKLAIREFSDGFVDVSFKGVTMEVREYVREDGKKVTLVPMSHVGESQFYETLAASFPPDAVVLMEGVSDKQKLLPNAPNYSKMATLIGAAEQQQVYVHNKRNLTENTPRSLHQQLQSLPTTTT